MSETQEMRHTEAIGALLVYMTFKCCREEKPQRAGEMKRRRKGATHTYLVLFVQISFQFVCFFPVPCCCHGEPFDLCTRSPGASQPYGQMAQTLTNKLFHGTKCQVIFSFDLSAEFTQFILNHKKLKERMRQTGGVVFQAAGVLIICSEV